VLARPRLDSDVSTEPERVPRRIRLFVAAFLAVFVFCGAFGREAWPFTGWKLFSYLRYDHNLSLTVATVDPAGVETPIAFGDLPRAYGWAPNIMSGFPKLTPARQEAVCAAWASAVRARGEVVVAVRIYEEERYASRRDGNRGAAPFARTLRYTCGNGAVEVAT